MFLQGVGLRVGRRCVCARRASRTHFFAVTASVMDFAAALVLSATDLYSPLVVSTIDVYALLDAPLSVAA